jgi:branched-chain amino acid transport system ATP-binding protein
VEDLFGPIFEYFPRLAERRRQPAGKLSGGEQQMLVIGRALLSQPKAVLIDELSLGLAPKLVQTLFEMIVRLNRERGMTFLLVEQASAVLEISNRAYLLQKGHVVHEGDARELLSQVDVLRSAYLGIQSGHSATAIRR